MAAVMRMEDEKIEQICTDVTALAGKGVVVAANYNCPGQLVISGNKEAVVAACEKLLEAGARRALMLPVGGAFHSPLMQPAKDELEAAIAATQFHVPACPVYQNVDGKAHINPEEIKQNLIDQLTASVRWTQEVEAMVEAGATEFVECGPGQALTGMITKIAKDAVVMHA
jgi:[acyl-carrier-protein] S-malonyltransferase